MLPCSSCSYLSTIDESYICDNSYLNKTYYIPRILADYRISQDNSHVGLHVRTAVIAIAILIDQTTVSVYHTMAAAINDVIRSRHGC